MNNILTIAQRNAGDAAALEREIDTFLLNLTKDNVGEQLAVIDQFIENVPVNIVDKVLTNTIIHTRIFNLNWNLMTCDRYLMQRLSHVRDHEINFLYGQLVEIIYKNITAIKNTGVSFLYFLFKHHQEIFYKLTDYTSKKYIDELSKVYFAIKEVVAKNSNATDPSKDESLKFVLDHLEQCIYDGLVFHMTNSSTCFDIFSYPSVLNMAGQNNKMGAFICEKYKQGYQGYLENTLNKGSFFYNYSAGVEPLAYLIVLTKNDDELKRLVTESLFQKDSNGTSLLLRIFKVANKNKLENSDTFISIDHSIGDETHWLSFFQEFLLLADTEQNLDDLVNIMTSLPRLFACLFALNSHNHHSRDLIRLLSALQQRYSTREIGILQACKFPSLLKELLQRAKEHPSIIDLIECILSIDKLLDKMLQGAYPKDLKTFFQLVATEFPEGGIDQVIRTKVKKIIADNNSDRDSRNNSVRLIRSIFEQNPTYFWQLCEKERDFNNAYSEHITGFKYHYIDKSSTILFQSVRDHLPEFLKFMSKMDDNYKKKLFSVFVQHDEKYICLSEVLVESCPTHMLFIAIHLHEENNPALEDFLHYALDTQYFKIRFPDYINFVRDNFDRFFSSEDIVIKLLAICPEDIHVFLDKAPNIAKKMICKQMDFKKRSDFIRHNPAPLLAILVWLNKNEDASNFDSWQCSLLYYIKHNKYGMSNAFHDMTRFAPKSIEMLKSIVTNPSLKDSIDRLLSSAVRVGERRADIDVTYSTAKMREVAQGEARLTLFSQQSGTLEAAVDSRPVDNAP